MMSDTRFKATKFDANKPPMDLIPWEAMEEISKVLDFGRVKYAPHNWRKGFEWGRLVGAALRHCFKWLAGEDNDPESGLNHLAHACCDLMFLLAHIVSGLGKDDRAHKLLAEQPDELPAARVPKHTTKGYRWWYRTWHGWSKNLPVVYISRDVANRAMDAFLLGEGRSMRNVDYELREVDIE